jgi:hypothetical protein
MCGRHSIAAIAGVLGLLLTSCATAAEEGTGGDAKPVDPSGSWKWDYTFNDNPAEFHLMLDWNGKQLTGKYTAFNNTTDIEETKLENNQLSFVANREFNGNEFVVHFDGKVELDDITGTVGVDFGDGPQEFDWHAKRAVRIDDVLGTWRLHLDTPNGVIEPEITITKDGEKLHGDYSSPFGEREAHDVTLKDNELSWQIESNDDDQFDFEIVYRGKPRGNSISGTNEYDFGGNTGTMEFTGKRTPPEDKKEPVAAAEAEAAAAPAPADAAPNSAAETVEP